MREHNAFTTSGFKHHISFFYLPLLATLAIMTAACDAMRTTPDGECPNYNPVVLEAGAITSGAGHQLKAAWHDLGLISSVRSAAGIIVSDDEVLVATSDGLWRRPLGGSGSWVRSGLAGHEVLALEKAPNRDELVFAGIAIPDTAESMTTSDAVVPFYRSEDGGLTWSGYGEGLFDEDRGLYDPVSYLAPMPGTDGEIIYAALGASSIARSTDGGASWTFVSGGPGGFGYPCQIHIPEDDPRILFQGCESPLDFAWIRTLDVGSSAAADLGEGCTVVDLDDISNRRPNVITSFKESPGRVFAGLEGALIQIRENGWDWIWRRDESDVDVPYTYVKFVWVNPDDSAHMVFGGGDGEDPMRGGLYETFDGGDQVTILDGPADVDFTDWGIFAGTPVNEGRDFVIVHVSEAGARVLRRSHTE